MSDNSAHDSERLRELVEECLDRIEDEGTAAIDAVCAENPQHAERVRSRMRMLRQAGLLQDDPVEELPERLGDFRLKSVLGSGGMGVVYLAEQESLKRDVALKLIRPEHTFFPGAQERFQREVEAIARLDHPGIVKVHSFGEENGVRYFAMELVRGRSLAAVLSGLAARNPAELAARDLTQRDTAATSWVRACCQLVLAVAEALAHAHERGVLHRDVKPSNIMIAEGGRPLLLDFGLARASGTHSMTRSGSAVGSLPYMAPEQLRGEQEAIGPRTDVYALGVTLYELLTLRAAFHEETPERTSARVLAGSAEPITRINAAVPWDAETVCTTAMDPDPARRYASAGEFAADLRCFLEHRPIAARRPGALLRTRRAAERHPAKATALILGLAVLVLAPLVFAFLQRGNIRRLESALGDAKKENRRAETNFDHALDAVRKVLTRLADVRLAKLPFVDEVKRDVLADVVAFYDELEKDEQRLEVRAAKAEALIEIGRLRLDLGEHDKARADLERGMAGARQLLESWPGARRLIARGWLRIGHIEKRVGRETAMRTAWESGSAAAADLVAAGDDLDALGLLAQLESHLAMLDGFRGERSAIDRLTRAIARIEGAAGFAKSSAAWLTTAGCYQNLGTLCRLFGQSSRAVLGHFRSAIDHYERARALADDPTHVELALAGHYFNLAHYLRAQGRHKAAARQSRAAIAIWQKLTRRHPSLPSLQLGLSRSQVGLATDQHAAGADAQSLLAEAVTRVERVLETYPDFTDALEDLAIALGTQARVFAERQRHDAARDAWDRALAAQRRLVERVPDRHAVHENLAITLNIRARFEEDAGRVPAALELLRESRTACREGIARTKNRAAPIFSVYRTALLGLARLTSRNDAAKGVDYLREAVREGRAAPSDLAIVNSWRLAERTDVQELLRSLEDK